MGMLEYCPGAAVGATAEGRNVKFGSSGFSGLPDGFALSISFLESDASSVLLIGNLLD
jgi:hypothetical protein